MQILGLNFREKIKQKTMDRQCSIQNNIALISNCNSKLKSLNTDVFQRNSDINKNISFTGVERFMTHRFENTFTKQFFKKVLREGVPDAYSNINLIPLECVDELKQLKVLNHKGSLAIKLLKPFKDDMFDIEKEIFCILENLSKKHPEMTLQELLKLKYTQAEKVLIKQQSNVLNKINMMARQLPKKEFHQMRELIQTSFNRIFEVAPLPEERFGRKEFIRKLKGLKLSDKELKEKMVKVAETLPQSSNSVNAFIVKYSQPYKIRTGKDGTQLKLRRDSEELAIRLLEESVGTDDHIYPKTKYFAEEQARISDENFDGDVSDFRVTILTSKKINNQKTDILVDDFITQTNPELPNYIQNHVNRLIEIVTKWESSGKYTDAEKLSDYIIVLRDEFAKRSEIVKLDIGDIENRLPSLREKAANQVEKKQAKRLKKTGHADNTHKKELSDGAKIQLSSMKNRKRHKHSSRFE